jgi:hypothetical protein
VTKLPSKKPAEKHIEVSKRPSNLIRESNVFEKAKANMMKPPQDFYPRRTPEAPDVALKGLMEVVALLTKQMGEIMRRMETPVLYPHPPPPIQAQHQPLFQAYPYHQHQQQHPVVRMPNMSPLYGATPGV